MSEAKKNADKSTAQTITRKSFNLSVNMKTDFSETLEITRTLFKDKVSKTSIVEASLACAAASAVNTHSMTCTQIATFIIKNLKVKDCFHKREANKSKDVLKSTILRVRHHIVDTLKTHHKADKLYSYTKSTDSVLFTDRYQKLCSTDKIYRKRVTALMTKVKIQYTVKAAVKKAAVKKAAKKVAAKKVA